MSFESEFLQLMTDTVTRQAFAGFNDYGRPTHSTASSSYSARVVFKHDRMRDDDGVDKVITAVAWIASTAAFDPDDLITLPDGSQPKALQFFAYPDEDGRYHHIKMIFGKMQG